MVIALTTDPAILAEIETKMFQSPFSMLSNFSVMAFFCLVTLVIQDCFYQAKSENKDVGLSIIQTTEPIIDLVNKSSCCDFGTNTDTPSFLLPLPLVPSTAPIHFKRVQKHIKSLAI